MFDGLLVPRGYTVSQFLLAHGEQSDCMSARNQHATVPKDLGAERITPSGSMGAITSLPTAASYLRRSSQQTRLSSPPGYRSRYADSR